MEFGLRMSKKTCAKYAMKREGKGFVIDAECAFGPMKSVTRTTITGDFQSSYAMRIEGTPRAASKCGDGKKGPQPTLMVHTARWAGAACTGGMKPGDMTMPGGIKVNVKQLQEAAEHPAQAEGAVRRLRSQPRLQIKTGHFSFVIKFLLRSSRALSIWRLAHSM